MYEELAVPDGVKPQIVVFRKWFTDLTTIGELSLYGTFECHTLEDTCRKVKVAKLTAIPSGVYRMILDYSDRFGFSPLILDVPYFTFLRMHPGNKAEDTDGCTLVGKYDPAYPNVIAQSRAAFGQLFPKIEEINKREKIFIEFIGGVPKSEFKAAA